MDAALPEAHRLLTEAIDALCAAAGRAASDEVLLSVLGVCEGAARRLDRAVVGAVSELQRRGAFAERGYRTPVSALCDLAGWERFEARRRLVAAEQVCPRIGLDGATLPARLPATAAAFGSGQASLRHVEVIAKALESASAQRLTAPVWAAAEVELAAKASLYTPPELAAWGAALVEKLDADGAEPDESELAGSTSCTGHDAAAAAR